MKTITSDFKEELTKLGREIDFRFFLHTNDKIITEDGKFLMTEANSHLVVEQFNDEEVDEIIYAEDIINVNIITCGNILSTMMKELDFEIKKDLRIGDVIDCEFGLKVNGDYEYINYGSYMVYSKEYNEDTQTYSYVAYDRMMLTMQEANAEFLDALEEETIADDISTICSTVGLTYTATQEELETYPNLSKEINDGTFTDLQITYRDILDMMCQALGLSMIVEDKQLILKPLDRTIKDTFDETYLKDTNAIFSKKYGPINSVVLSRSEGNDNIYVRDEESIANNGLCEFKIKDNPILLYNDREDYIDEIFDQLNGLEYYPNDFSSTGITYLDWLDFYNVTIGNKIYKCIMLNDEIKIEQGLEESIYSEEPEETETPYKTSSKTDKEVSFIVDKQNGYIRTKVSKGQVINEINLDESGVEINADKINLNGAVTANNNFKILPDGSMEAVNGKFTGDITGSEIKGSHLTLNSRDNYNAIVYYDSNNNKTGEFGGDTLNIGFDTNDNSAIVSIHGYYNLGQIYVWDNDGQSNAFIASGYNNYTVIKSTGIETPSLYVSGSKNRVVTINNGKKVCLGAYETATPYFGDIGSDKTNDDGFCKIEIENIFSQTIEQDNYKVFIQECGEGHLYVEKHKDYFVIKGTPNLDFDWEIKAIQKGYKEIRLQEKGE